MATNIAASVHQRLLNVARESARPFNELLQLYAIERFIYRLSRSRYADRFILKGALMLLVHNRQASRPTLDIDLLGRIANSHAVIVSTMQDICEAVVDDDGMIYDAQSVRASRIAENAECHGVRVRIQATLGSARVPIQIDIGFGDIVIPHPRKFTYPALLEFSAAVVSGYSAESIIAEKLHAMVQHGVLNSRMKDFYDIWALARTTDFQGAILSRAIEATFQNRTTRIPDSVMAFSATFVADGSKQTQWSAFIRKSRLIHVPLEMVDVIHALRSFLAPVMASLAENRVFDGTWVAGGPWS